MFVDVGDSSSSDLARLLGDLAVHVQGQFDVDATLQAIVEGAVELVPGARWAGISLNEKGSVRAKAPTDPLVAELDELQNLLNEGPCLEALREHRTIQIEDMGNETRWPRYAEAARERGVRSVLSFQLFVTRENLGALNLYASEPAVFNEESLDVGDVLAQHASIAIAAARAEVNFDAAVASRDIIGQAKGIVMQRENLTGLQAFQLLLKTSQNANLKLVEIARWLVEQHESGLNQP
jgi:GAF domain-containing protein